MVNADNLQNATNLYDLTQKIQTETNGLLGIIILATTWLALYFALTQRYTSRTSFNTTNFLTSIIASLLFFIDLIEIQIVVIPIILLVFGLITHLNQRL